MTSFSSSSRNDCLIFSDHINRLGEGEASRLPFSSSLSSSSFEGGEPEGRQRSVHPFRFFFFLESLARNPDQY